jgi:hypothetical protein
MATRILASLVLVVLVLVLVPHQASASEPAEPRTTRETVTLVTSLVTPFFGAYYLEGKIRASSSVALAVNASYLTLEHDAWKTKAGTVGAGVAYFFQGDALRRWYVEAIGEIWVASRRHEPSGGIAPLGVGYAAIALVGYQFVFEAGPVVDLGAGVVAFHLPSAHVEAAGASSEALTKIYPAAKVDVGWAF